MRRTLSAGSAVRVFLENLERNGAVLKPFPLESLRLGEHSDTPGIAYFLDRNKAFKAIYDDLSRASSRVVWNWPAHIEEIFNDDFIRRALPSNAECVVAGKVSEADRARFGRRGVRVETEAAPDFLRYVENEVFWFLGRLP
jgi:hypothetical protein